MPLFAERMTSLAPGAEIGCYWDTLDILLPLIKEGRISSDTTVAVCYKDSNLNPLEHDWEINPGLYEGIKNVAYGGRTDLVEVIHRKIYDIGMRSTREADEYRTLAGWCSRILCHSGARFESAFNGYTT